MLKAAILCVVATLLFSVQTEAEARTARYGLNFCNEPGFYCITVKPGQTWQRLFPNEYERQIVRRLNRMNTRLRSGMRIAVPHDLSNTDLLDVSPFPGNIKSPGEKMIVVDPPTLAWAAYDAYGNLVHWGPISGGKGYCSDVQKRCRTVSGHFRMYRKDDAKCVSKKFPLPNGGAPMPHCMFFHGGFAMHASTTVPGYHASHGCVRIFAEDAEWLNEEFIDLPRGDQRGTRVIINPYM